MEERTGKYSNFLGKRIIKSKTIRRSSYFDSCRYLRPYQPVTDISTLFDIDLSRVILALEIFTGGISEPSLLVVDDKEYYRILQRRIYLANRCQKLSRYLNQAIVKDYHIDKNDWKLGYHSIHRYLDIPSLADLLVKPELVDKLPEKIYPTLTQIKHHLSYCPDFKISENTAVSIETPDDYLSRETICQEMVFLNELREYLMEDDLGLDCLDDFINFYNNLEVISSKKYNWLCYNHGVIGRSDDCKQRRGRMKMKDKRGNKRWRTDIRKQFRMDKFDQDYHIPSKKWYQSSLL